MKEITAFKGDYRWLSNFWPTKLMFEGAWYPSVENAYQAAKFPSAQRKHFQLCDAYEAKRTGQKATLPFEWNSRKVDVMLSLLEQKFAYGTELAVALMATGELPIIEGNTWGDTYWGQCNGKGSNYLGLMLMGIRTRLHSKQPDYVAPVKDHRLGELKKIKPNVSGKFSPNLYRYLKAHPRYATEALVYRHQDDGQLWLGIIDQDKHEHEHLWFSGARLLDFLCNGVKCQTFAHPDVANHLRLVPEFWEQYGRMGRCALDAEHSIVFIGDAKRWKYEGDRRYCQWCLQHTQTLTKESKTTEIEHWVVKPASPTP